MYLRDGCSLRLDVFPSYPRVRKVTAVLRVAYRARAGPGQDMVTRHQILTDPRSLGTATVGFCC